MGSYTTVDATNGTADRSLFVYSHAMTLRHLSMWIIGLIAFAMNPAFACSSSDGDEFEFGEAEMIAAVQGTWQLTYARPEQTSSVAFTIAPGAAASGTLASPPGLAPQCGTRTFTRPAAACTPESVLTLAAGVVEATPPLETAQGKGVYRVSSIQYVGGRLELTFGTSLRVTADLDASNAVRQSYVDWQGARVTSVLEHTTTK
jgi:hypothetical protein